MKKQLLAMLLISTMCLSACGSISGASSDASGAASKIESSDASSNAQEVKEPNYTALDYVTLGDYKNLSINVNKTTVTEEDVQTYIDEILSMYGSYEEIDKDKAEDGDRVRIDYVGTIDGEEFDGGSYEDDELVIGEEMYLSDFEDAIIGHSVGDTFDVDVTFPEDYDDELAGKTATFSITLNAILSDEQTIPEFDDTFAKEYTEDDDMTAEELKTQLQEEMKSENEETLESDTHTALLEALYNVCEVPEIPQEIEDYYIDYYKSLDEGYASSYGLEFEEYVQMYYGYESEEDYMEEVTEVVKESIAPEAMIVKAVAEKEGISITDEDVKETIYGYAQDYGYDNVDDFAQLMGYDDYDGLIETIGTFAMKEGIMEDRVVEILEQTATITYSEASGDATE